MLTDTNNAREAMDDTLGGRISLARDNAGLSIEDAADQLGVLVESWTAWECDSSVPRANKMTTMAGILGVSPSWLLSGLGQGPIDHAETAS
ncbi:helix-turn-helix domain-containing protein [Tianweitania sp. BSSL-BM11]|uniref:Helix-turn-helix domain-containing protein n=1 Tax=Tianweitania aestuarii TaxID=2814886 RepID=A0ABS5RTL2_9HYPH|nr:helix-turn-helix transcriptional regulator [Tianweitania aestuarii]MBS9719672.1 helix-turn-helix domain-containing protein [Tianweitania aestuarii]